MAKTLVEAKLSNRADRKRLSASDTPYWRGIDPEVHLGYRKGKRGGTWVVRWRVGAGYRQRRLGTADDELREGTLDFDEAVKAARSSVETDRREARAIENGPAPTVKNAVEVYMAGRDARDTARKGRNVRSDASSRLVKYVIGRTAVGKRQAIPATALAEIALHELSEKHLGAWREQLPKAMKWTTKQRLGNDLKAALNEAYASNRASLEPTFPVIVKHGLRGFGKGEDGDEHVARDNLLLSDQQVARLIKAAREVDDEQGWQGDLFRLVVVLAATGSRFSQIIRLRVGDVQVASSRLMVPVSRKGRGTKNAGTPVPIGDDVLQIMLPTIDGRSANETLLERWRNKQTPGSIKWERDGRGPWKTASELTRPWNAIRKRADLAPIIPYALRHSSIVRGIRANLPIRLVASLHDTSVQMIERHYGRFIADGLDELAAKAVVPLIDTVD
ncbi:MAG: tyrosine-type recombinase/integrase [Pseudomonadota bacterium]